MGIGSRLRLLWLLKSFIFFKIGLMVFDGIFIPLRSLKHSKQRHDTLAGMRKYSSKVISDLSCRNDIIKSSVEELPSSKVLRTFISQHKEFSGGICTVEQNPFWVVIVVCGLVATSVPDFTAVIPEQVFYV